MPLARRCPGAEPVYLRRMDINEQLRAWGAVHAQARAAESSLQETQGAADSRRLQSEAKALRERADRLHREIYASFDARERKTR